jgi:Fe2+ or Zn2+ uptake regulation protein
MPTVHRFQGLRVVIYSNDHRPAHVHVMGRGCEAVFRLHAPSGPPELRENYGFSASSVALIERELA